MENLSVGIYDLFVLSLEYLYQALILIVVILRRKLICQRQNATTITRILNRILFYHLKAKFIAIENNLTEFMEEFMPHLIIMDKSGNSTTLGQSILPQYKKALDSGRQTEFKLLPEAEKKENKED